MKARAYFLFIAAVGIGGSVWAGDGKLPLRTPSPPRVTSGPDFSDGDLQELATTQPVLAAYFLSLRGPSERSVTPIAYHIRRSDGGLLVTPGGTPLRQRPIASPATPLGTLNIQMTEALDRRPWRSVTTSAPSSPVGKKTFFGGDGSSVDGGPPGGSNGRRQRLRAQSADFSSRRPPLHPRTPHYAPPVSAREEEAHSPAVSPVPPPALETPDPHKLRQRRQEAQRRRSAAIIRKEAREEEARRREAGERSNLERERTDMQKAEWESREHEAECYRQQQVRLDKERVALQKEKMQAQFAQPTAQATVHYRDGKSDDIKQIILPVWRLISADQGVDLPNDVSYVARLSTGRLVPVEHDAGKNGYYLPDPLPTKPLTSEEAEKQLEVADAVELLPIEPSYASPRQAFGGGVLSSAGVAALIYALTQYVGAFKSDRRARQVVRRIKERAQQSNAQMSPEQLSQMVRGFYDDSRKMRVSRNKKLLRGLLATVLGSAAVAGGIKLARAKKPIGTVGYTWTDRHYDCPG